MRYRGAGDKLLVFRHPKEGCFTLVKLEAARDFLNQMSSLIRHQMSGARLRGPL